MKRKKIKYILFHRLVLVGLALVAQIAVLLVMLNEFSTHFDYFYWMCIVVSILATLWIVNDRSESAYKIAWLILILPFPVFGGAFYLLMGGNRISERTRRKMQGIAERSNEVLQGDFKADRLTDLGEDVAGQARYLEKYAACPVYTNTQTRYFPVGDLAFVQMLEELEKAERYIFLEYFIIQEGECWDRILELLERKAAAGVEVRLIYDDFGCMFTLPQHYNERMAERGIQCRVFNRLVPVLTLRMNNRDHRKLCIIDGKVGFTGGMNLADEYINRKVRFGHWKDSAILLQGEAVWSMTVMFLSMWDYCSGWEEDFDLFRPGDIPAASGLGWVQPYTDTPLDHEKVGQAVYLNMISRARDYINITTPYLIVDAATSTALCNAAKAGVDVRIITPHIPDKRSVFEVTRAHYPPLLEAGVKIYEYTPGFIHAKNFVVDGQFATVGTVNLDYRSLFLHFENGVWMYATPSIVEIKADFDATLDQCEEITLRRARHLNLLVQLYRSILRIFAPLM